MMVVGYIDAADTELITGRRYRLPEASISTIGRVRPCLRVIEYDELIVALEMLLQRIVLDLNESDVVHNGGNNLHYELLRL